jgi:type VI secretion system secreted protein Hcp
MPTDMFLQLDGIKGESTDEKHKEWIEISSWGASWEQPLAQAKAATGPSVEKCRHEPITVAKIMDKATPAILKHIWGGKIIKEGKIECFRADSDSAPFLYLTITMQFIIIATYSISGAEGDMPGEEVGLSCGYVKYEYAELKHDGPGEGGKVAAEVNLILNKIA